MAGAKGTEIVDPISSLSSLAADASPIARRTGLVDSRIPRVQRTGQRGDHRTDNNNSQHEKRCSSQSVGSVVAHVFSPFYG